MKASSIVVFFAVAVFIYFIALFILSCFDEIQRIKEFTRHYNLCSDEEFERKLAEILIELKFIKDYNFFTKRDYDVIFISYQIYRKSRKFREMCYRTGIKPRLEKQFKLLSDDDNE